MPPPPADCAQASQQINSVAIESGELHKELVAKKNIPDSQAHMHSLLSLATGDPDATERLKALRTSYYELRFYARSNKCRAAKSLPSFEVLREDIYKHPVRYYGHTPDIRRQLGVPASEASVRALLKKMETGDLMVQLRSQLLQVLKKRSPETPEAYWMEALNALDTDEMLDQIIPVYQKYLSEHDVQQLKSFYDSDTGKKLVSVQPLMTKEAMILGQQWSLKKAQEINKKAE